MRIHLHPLTTPKVMTMNRLLLLILTLLAASATQAREAPGVRLEDADSVVNAPVVIYDVSPVTDTELEAANGLTATLPDPLVPPADPVITPLAGNVPLPEQDLPTVAKPRLLPEKMSFMERGLWGENGLFRSWGITGELTPETRKHELDVRRTMLTMHQIGGFTTLASMIATVYFGQKFLDTGDRNALDMHETFIPITVGLYSATALLSVLSPPPLIRRDEVSTTSIHKLLAWVHVAGMIITPILGAAIGRRNASFEQKARVHQVAGYITTGVFAASMIIITF
jgi:hypothetical protein